jgi:hypothetical protein
MVRDSCGKYFDENFGESSTPIGCSSLKLVWIQKHLLAHEFIRKTSGNFIKDA